MYGKYKTPKIAKSGCLIAACVTLCVGVPMSFLGSIIRKYYGPDSPHSQFDADTCSSILMLPTCGKWEPDPVAFMRFATNEAPAFLGGWVLIAIVAATMSTADGAILALGTVMANNVFRQLDVIYPKFVNPDNLLPFARLSSLPLTLAATAIAAFYRSNESHAAGATGYLLIVAFDVVLATVAVPLFGAFYAKTPSPRAALCSILGGALTRLIMEFALPKDGSLLLPFPEDEFLDYGPAASVLPPLFINATEVWDPSVEQCDQETFEDYTGVVSLTAALVALLLFVTVQFLEHHLQRPLFCFPGSVGYVKDRKGEDDKLQNWTHAVEVLFAVILSYITDIGSLCVHHPVVFTNASSMVVRLSTGGYFLDLYGIYRTPRQFVVSYGIFVGQGFSAGTLPTVVHVSSASSFSD